MQQESKHRSNRRIDTAELCKDADCQANLKEKGEKVCDDM